MSRSKRLQRPNSNSGETLQPGCHREWQLFGGWHAVCDIAAVTQAICREMSPRVKPPVKHVRRKPATGAKSAQADQHKSMTAARPTQADQQKSVAAARPRKLLRGKPWIRCKRINRNRSALRAKPSWTRINRNRSLLRSRVQADQPKPMAAAKPVQADQPKPMAAAKPVQADQVENDHCGEAVQADQPKPIAAAKPVQADQPKTIAAAKPVQADQPKTIAAAKPVQADQPKTVAAAKPVQADQPKTIAAAKPVQADQPKTLVAKSAAAAKPMQATAKPEQTDQRKSVQPEQTVTTDLSLTELGAGALLQRTSSNIILRTFGLLYAANVEHDSNEESKHGNSRVRDSRALVERRQRASAGTRHFRVCSSRPTTAAYQSKSMRLLRLAPVRAPASALA